MRNHFLRASGTATGGDGGGGDGGGGGSCGTNDTGGTNEWTLIAAKTDGLFAAQHEFTSSIDFPSLVEIPSVPTTLPSITEIGNPNFDSSVNIFL